MAALQGQVAFGAGATCPLSAGVAKTPAVVTAPSNQRLKILGYGFFFDGTVNSAQPVEIDIKRASATGAGTTATPQPNEGELTETFQASWLINCGTEPTYTSTLKTITVHPQLGYEYLAPAGQEIIVKGGGILGFQANAPAAVNIRGYVMYEE
jgi:hypothetical protein